MLRATILAMLINAAVLTGADAKPELTLKVDPQVAFIGRPIMVNVTIKPHPELRAARVVMFPFADSTWQIDPRKNDGVERRSFVFRIPEAGEYDIILVVYDGTGKELGRRSVPIKRAAPDAQ